MMFRPTLLLWGAIVVTAVPAWADRIFSADVAKDSPAIESPVKPAHHPDPNLNALLVSGFPARPTPAVMLIDTFETHDASTEGQPRVEIPSKVTLRSDPQVNASVNADSLPDLTPELALSDNVSANAFFDSRSWWFSEPKGKFFRSLPDTNSHAASASHVNSHNRASFASHVWETWRTEGQGSRRNDGNKNPHRSGLAPAVVPEPGSLSLLLLGLAAVGFLGRRRESC
jgi:hypothetical protein